MNGTLIKEWMSAKGFRPVDENPPADDGDGHSAGGGGHNRPCDFYGGGSGCPTPGMSR